MTDISLTVPAEADTLVEQGLIVREAAAQAWRKLPEQIRMKCKKIKVVYRGVTFMRNVSWTIHYIFQLGDGFPEFAVMYHTGKMGYPRDEYVLREFTTEQLADILSNGQSQKMGREQKLGLLAAFHAKVDYQHSTHNSRGRTIARYTSPDLEVRATTILAPDLLLVRPRSIDITPDQFMRLCREYRCKILDDDLVTVFDSVFETRLAGVIDLAAIQHNPRHGYCMCVSLRTEVLPRYNVWVNGTDVWQQTIDARAWFIVKR